MKVASLLLVALCAARAFVGSGVRTPHRSRAPADALVAHSSASPATEPPATPTADEIDAEAVAKAGLLPLSPRAFAMARARGAAPTAADEDATLRLTASERGQLDATLARSASVPRRRARRGRRGG